MDKLNIKINKFNKYNITDKYLQLNIFQTVIYMNDFITSYKYNQ